MPPGSAGGTFFNTESNYGQTSPAPRDSGPTAQIPFAIPLHPTPKTYRSQSYSVGQLEPDAPPAAMSSSAMMGRGRAHGHSGLQHRPSRPSMLSEMSNDGGLLGKVKEVDDDDDESATESMQGSMHQSAEAKTIELLARENAMLRQQQYQNRLRPRASTGAAYGLGNGYSLRESVPEESDFAIDELDEAHDGNEMAAKRALGRRMSEFGATGFRSPYENRNLENVKKAYWHSSLGFGGPEGQQSRRHSFADIPTRQGSISSINESFNALDTPVAEQQQPQDFSLGYSENPNYPLGSTGKQQRWRWFVMVNANWSKQPHTSPPVEVWLPRPKACSSTTHSRRRTRCTPLLETVRLRLTATCTPCRSRGIISCSTLSCSNAQGRMYSTFRRALA